MVSKGEGPVSVWEETESQKMGAAAESFLGFFQRLGRRLAKKKIKIEGASVQGSRSGFCFQRESPPLVLFFFKEREEVSSRERALAGGWSLFFTERE